MLGGKTVIMAGVHLRGDLYRKPEPAAAAEGEGEKEKEKPNTTAISIGRYAADLTLPPNIAQQLMLLRYLKN